MIARIRDVQKLKQKSHSNSREISFGALAIILSLIPNFPIRSIIKADTKATSAESVIIQYIVDIVL